MTEETRSQAREGESSQRLATAGRIWYYHSTRAGLMCQGLKLPEIQSLPETLSEVKREGNPVLACLSLSLRCLALLLSAKISWQRGWENTACTAGTATPALEGGVQGSFPCSMIHKVDPTDCAPRSYDILQRKDTKQN